MTRSHRADQPALRGDGGGGQGKVPLRRGGEPSSLAQVDVRYFGQSRYLTVDAPAGEWAQAELQTVIDAFGAEHEREYGYDVPPCDRVELANIRVVVELPVEKVRPAVAVEPTTASVHVRFTSRGRASCPRRSTGVRRFLSACGVDGPAILEQADSTTLVPPDATGVALEDGSFRITFTDATEGEA